MLVVIKAPINFPPCSTLNRILTRAAHNQHTHAWTHEQRVCVHILWEEHILSSDDRAKVFNEIFKDPFVIGKSDSPSRTAKFLSRERSKRHDHGSCPWKAWQAVSSIANDIQEQSMVDRMRRRVDSLLRSNSLPATPPRSVSSNRSSHPTALLRDIEKFANFTKSVTRKRNIAALCTPPSTTGEDAGGSEDAPRPKRSRHTARDKSPTVVIPKTPDTQTLQSFFYVKQPSDSRATRRATCMKKPLSVTQIQGHSDGLAPVSYQRMGNLPLMLSPAKYKSAPSTEAPCNDISEEDAHPCLPSLLWRYWDPSSQGANSASGFKSGRRAHARVPPRRPPLCKNLEWMDVLEHLNPSKSLEHRIRTPFISTSSRLLWLLRKALRKQHPSGRISLIDSSVLNPQGIYYVPPFHTELKRRFVFDNGAQYYKGISEHLVWNEIAPSAMIKTISLEEFCAFTNGNRDVKRLMRLEKLKSNSKLDEISRMAKRDCVKLTDSIAVAIAELVIFFGLDHKSCREKLSRLVYEVAQDWALTPESVAQSSWQTKAQWFTHTICRRSDEPVSFAEQSKIYHS
jgi:hypothetical protein